MGLSRIHTGKLPQKRKIKWMKEIGNEMETAMTWSMAVDWDYWVSAKQGVLPGDHCNRDSSIFRVLYGVRLFLEITMSSSRRSFLSLLKHKHSPFDKMSYSVEFQALVTWHDLEVYFRLGAIKL